MNQIKGGIILNYVIIVLNILTGLLYTPFMLRTLGQNEYGMYSLVSSVIAYLTLLDFGFGSAIVRYTAKTRATGSKTDEWKLYGMFICGYTLIGIIVAIAGSILYSNVDNMFDRTMTPDELSQARIMMALMIANFAVTFPFSIFGSIIIAYERFVFQRTIGIIRILLSTGVMVTVLLMGYKAVGLVVVQTIFSVASLSVNVWYCKYRLKIKVIFGNFDIPLFKEIMVFSFWNFLGAIIDRVYWSTGQFVLGIYCGTVSVAIFSVAVTLQSMYLTMSTSINSVLLPRITKMSTKKGTEKELSNLFILTGRLQFCILGLILSSFAVFGHSFVTIWAGEDYSQSYIIALMYMTALLVPLIQNVGLLILQARAQQKFRSLCYLAIAIVSLIFQVILAQKYGAVGCAIAIVGALMLGQWIIMNIYYLKVQKLDILKFFSQILRMAIVPAVFVAVGLAVQTHLEISSWFELFIGIALYLMLYLPSFWKFCMNDYEKSQIMIPINKLVAMFNK